MKCVDNVEPMRIGTHIDFGGKAVKKERPEEDFHLCRRVIIIWMLQKYYGLIWIGLIRLLTRNEHSVTVKVCEILQ
jgi:hypothetical protein